MIISKKNVKRNIFENLHLRLPNYLASALMKEKFDSLYSGAQCTYFYIMNNTLYFGNLGDIRLIVVYKKSNEWKYKLLSKVHSIDDPKELKRIKGNGIKFVDGSFYPSFVKEEHFNEHNKLVSTRYIGMFGAMADGINWDANIGQYKITQDDKIVLMVNTEILKLAKIEVLINKLTRYYEQDLIEVASEKFNQRVQDRADKLRLLSLDVCYSMTFIYKKSKYEEMEKQKPEESIRKVENTIQVSANL